MTDKEITLSEAKESFGKRYPDNSAINTYYVEGFNDGYNKANEWHVLRKNLKDFPKETTLVMLKACGCFMLGWFDGKNWYKDGSNVNTIPKESVIAWKEIIPPEVTECHTA